MENNNNKLGLAWQVCAQGKQDIPLCNEDWEWLRHLRDIRHYQKMFVGLHNPIKAVTFLSYTEHGAFVVSVAPHTDNPGNYKAVWIYVPNTIEISGDELAEACIKAKACLLSNQRVELKEDKLFSKEYPPKKSCADYNPSTNNNLFGIFRIERDSFNFNVILGDYLYQEHFSEYEAVFLLEKDEGINVNVSYRNKFTYQKSAALKKYFVLHLPNKNNLQGSLTVLLNSKRIDKDARVKIGDKLQFIVERTGFDDKSLTIKVADEESIAPNVVEENLNVLEWKKKISYNSLIFIGEDGKKIRDSRGIYVKVNDEEVGDGISIAEKDCEEASIKVDSQDYELANEDKYCLLKEHVEIKLKRKIKTMETKIELANGKIADITLKSQDLDNKYTDKKESPLKGYYYPKDEYGDTLRPTGVGNWGSYMIGALILLAVELVALCCYQIGTDLINYWWPHKLEKLDDNNDGNNSGSQSNDITPTPTKQQGTPKEGTNSSQSTRSQSGDTAPTSTQQQESPKKETKSSQSTGKGGSSTDAKEPAFDPVNTTEI